MGFDYWTNLTDRSFETCFGHLFVVNILVLCLLKM